MYVCEADAGAEARFPDLYGGEGPDGVGANWIGEDGGVLHPIICGIMMSSGPISSSGQADTLGRTSLPAILTPTREMSSR